MKLQNKQTTHPKRTDAKRNQQTLLNAAAELFITSGVEVPVRDIATKAGVGTGTIYRHFPTRADLIIAVYRYQVETCAEAGLTLLSNNTNPRAALTQWINLFIDFLTTKHGLAAALQSDKTGFDTLHTYFLERLIPICTQLLEAAIKANQIQTDIQAYELMRGIGNLCIGANNDPRYNPRRLVKLLIEGLHQP
jgi:AcrR family transcriptional regulator